PLQENVKDLLTSEEIYFLKSFGLLNKQNLHIFYWKTLKGYSITMRGKRLPLSLGRLQNWGIIFSGKCLTARISESHKTESESILLDILEQNPESKYFLSKSQLKNIIYRQPQKL